jgi:hypothetical protein
MLIRTRRAYDPPEPQDGARFLTRNIQHNNAVALKACLENRQAVRDAHAG